MNCGNSKFVDSSLLYVTLPLKGQLFYVYLCIWQFAWFLLSFIIYLKPKSFTEHASFVVFMFAALPISSLFPFLYFMVSMLLGKTLLSQEIIQIISFYIIMFQNLMIFILTENTMNNVKFVSL